MRALLMKLRLRLAMWLVGDDFRVYAREPMHRMAQSLMSVEWYAVHSGALNDGSVPRRARKRLTRCIHLTVEELGRSIAQVQSTLNN